MSAWVEDLSKALPDPAANDNQGAKHLGDDSNAETPKETPQEHGWAPPTGIDYDRYVGEQPAPGGKDVGDDAVGGILAGQWASEAAIYTWDDEYGDVGPAFPELEQQLFGQANHVSAGVNFAILQNINVTQEGTVRIKPVVDFKDAGLHPAMLENVRLANYIVPTPIQQYVLPAIAKGYDVISCAQTGSGKTAAFLIPVLSKLMGKAKKLAAPRPNPATFVPGVTAPVRAEPLVLIVCPTRELATQIFDEARRFCYRTMLRPCAVYGGGPLRNQIEQLQKGCDVLIGSPGRLCDLISRPHILSLKRLKYMVIDEADEMLHSDWESEMKTIMSGGDQEEGNIKYLMFSATFPKMCRDLARDHLAHDHVRIRVGRAGSSHQNIKQDIIFVAPEAKRTALYDLLMAAPPARTIIFVNSRRAADEVDDYLFNLNMPCTSIHGDRTQLEREDSLRAFKRGKTPILIATGVSARGLDIKNIMHVLNYDLPSSQYGGIEEYTHRIGRTGRIGNLGLATSFYSDRDADLADALVKVLIENAQSVPDFLQGSLPEGFTANEEGVVEGDADLLDFGDASDASDDGGGVAIATGGEGGAWGASGSGGGAGESPVRTGGISGGVDAWGAAEAVGGADKAAIPAGASSGQGNPRGGAANPGAANTTGDAWGASAVTAGGW